MSGLVTCTQIGHPHEGKGRAVKPLPGQCKVVEGDESFLEVLMGEVHHLDWHSRVAHAERARAIMKRLEYKQRICLIAGNARLFAIIRNVTL